MAAVVFGGVADVETPETPLDGDDVDVDEPAFDGEVVVVDGGLEVVAVEEPLVDGVVLGVAGGVVVLVLVCVGVGQIVRVGVGIGVPHHEPPFDEPWKGTTHRVDVLVGVTVEVPVGAQVDRPELWNGRMQDEPCDGVLPPEPW